MTKVNVYRQGNWNVDPQRTETTITELEKVPNTLSAINVTTGNGIEIISVGDLFPSREGGRLILRVRWNGADPGLFYLENGKIYGHHALYFFKESWMEAFQTGAHWARGGAMIAKMQVELCMGIMAGAGGKFADITLTAINVLKMSTEVDIVGLLKYIPKVLTARSILKRVAPTLYDKLFNKLVGQILDNLPETVLSTATAYLVGRITGRLGRTVPGKFMEALKDMAGWFATYVAIRIVAAAGAISKDLKALSTDIFGTLASIKVNVTQAEAEQIARELQMNQGEILRALIELQGGETEANSSPKRSEWERGFKI